MLSIDIKNILATFGMAYVFSGIAFSVLIITVLALAGMSNAVKDFAFGRHTKYTVLIISIIFVFFVIRGWIYIAFGNNKTFLLNISDRNNNKITDYYISKNTGIKEHFKGKNTININSQELFCSLQVQSKSLNGSKEIKNDDFVDSNIISIILNNDDRTIDCSSDSKDLKINFPVFTKVDDTGIFFKIPSNSKHNYVTLNNDFLPSNKSFEIIVDSLFLSKESNMYIDIGGVLAIYVGEGTLKHIKVRTNNTRIPIDWKDEVKYEMDDSIIVNKPFKLSITLNSDANDNISITLIPIINKVDQKPKQLELSQLPISNKMGIKIGIYNETKSDNYTMCLSSVKLRTNSK